MRGGAQIRSKIWILPATHAHSLHTDKNAMEHFGPKIGPPLNLSRVSYSGAVFSVLSPHQDLTSSFCLSFELWPTRMGFWGGTTASFVNIIFKNTVSTRESYLGAVFSVLYHRDLTSSLGRLWMNKMGFCGVFYASLSATKRCLNAARSGRKLQYRICERNFPQEVVISKYMRGAKKWQDLTMLYCTLNSTVCNVWF